MASPTFTPGPWRAVRNPMRDDGLFVVRDRRADERENYAGEMPPAVVPFQMPHADAHLVAAAPEMYGALLGVIDASAMAVECVHDSEPDICDHCALSREMALGNALSIARAVLRKADGR